MSWWWLVVRFIDRFYKLKSYTHTHKHRPFLSSIFSINIGFALLLPCWPQSVIPSTTQLWLRHSKIAHVVHFFCFVYLLYVCVYARALDFYYVVDDAIISWLTLHKKCFQAIKMFTVCCSQSFRWAYKAPEKRARAGDERQRCTSRGQQKNWIDTRTRVREGNRNASNLQCACHHRW